jgi:hypothetical protein
MSECYFASDRWTCGVHRSGARGGYERKESSMERIIRNFKDLQALRGEIDMEVDRYSIEGHLEVFPKREYEIHNIEELEDVMKHIDMFSSPYATVNGTVRFGSTIKNEH